MKIFLVPVLLAAIYGCYGSAEYEDKDRISFGLHDSDLAWPLPNPFNAGEQIIHGRHCYKEIQDTFDQSDAMSLMHQQHCWGIIEGVVKFFDKNPKFSVDPLICQAVTPEAKRVEVGRQRRSAQDPQALQDIDLEPQEDVYLRLKYGRKKRDMNPQALQDIDLEPQEDVYLRLKYGRKKRAMNMNMMDGPVSTNGTQNAVYMRLEGRNLGEVLLRNYTSPESLNPTERIYIKQWLNPRAIAMGAVGVYCRVRGDTAVVRKVLAETAKSVPTPPPTTGSGSLPFDADTKTPL